MSFINLNVIKIDGNDHSKDTLKLFLHNILFENLTKIVIKNCNHLDISDHKLISFKLLKPSCSKCCILDLNFGNSNIELIKILLNDQFLNLE